GPCYRRGRWMRPTGTSVSMSGRSDEIEPCTAIWKQSKDLSEEGAYWRRLRRFAGVYCRTPRVRSASTCLTCLRCVLRFRVARGRRFSTHCFLQLIRADLAIQRGALNTKQVRRLRLIPVGEDQ